LALTVAAVNPSWLVWWLCSLWIGFHLHRVALLSHEFAHFLVFKKNRFHDFISNLFTFYPLGASTDGYRKWHLAHHRHLNTEHDPEKIVKGGRLYQRPLPKFWIFALFITDLMGLGILEVLKLQWVVRPRSVLSNIGLVIFWGAIGFAAYHFQRLDLLGLYVLSMVTSFWAAYRLRAITEHVGTPSSHRFIADSFSRYFFFPYKTDHHFEHHEWPSIPWYALPDVRLKDRVTPIQTMGQLFHTLSTTTEIKPYQGSPLRPPAETSTNIISFPQKPL